MEQKHKLTDKQKRFCEEYLIDLNATQAAIRAGYSAKTADKIGSELLGKTSIAVQIEKRKKAQQRRTEITADRVLMEIAKIAFAEASDAGGAELKQSNKLKALEMAAKYFGMLADKQPSEDDDETGVVILPPRLPK